MACPAFGYLLESEDHHSYSKLMLRHSGQHLGYARTANCPKRNIQDIGIHSPAYIFVSVALFQVGTSSLCVLGEVS